MLKEIEYDRGAALAYAKQWALKRNPRYLDFENLGGDCTSFASQCILAGCGVMNYTPTFGWYYNSSSDRTASWSGVSYLYQFLTENRQAGPYAEETGPGLLAVGDIVQFGTMEDHFYHSPVVTGITAGRIFVSAHTFDAYMRPLDSYSTQKIRYLHIKGARKYI